MNYSMVQMSSCQVIFLKQLLLKIVGFFLSLNDTINALTPNFWKTNVKCYELILVINKFRICTQTSEYIQSINSNCCQQIPNILITPHLSKHMAQHLILRLQTFIIIHINFQMTQVKLQAYILQFTSNKIWQLNFVLEIMQHMMALLMELMVYSKHQHLTIIKPQFGYCSQIKK